MRTMIPVMRRNLAAFDRYRNREGLLESIPSWMFFDYADISGSPIRTDGVSVALNALYAKTLDEAARLERLVGDGAHAGGFKGLARQVRSVLNRCCCGDTFYPDVLLRNQQKDLVPSREACETTQYFAMWAGVPPLDRQKRMWQALRDDFIPTPLRWRRRSGGLPGRDFTRFSNGWNWPPDSATTPRCCAIPRPCSCPWPTVLPALFGKTPWPTLPCAMPLVAEWAESSPKKCWVYASDSPEDHAAQRRALRWCNGYITTPKGRIEVAWDWQKDRYQLRASIPKGIAAEVVLPREAKAVWQSAPAGSPWQETLTIGADAVIVVTPGNVTVKQGPGRQ